MGSSLQKKSNGTIEKLGILGSLVGGGVIGYFLTWFIGIPLMLVGGGYFFFKLLKVYASTGKRF